MDTGVVYSKFSISPAGTRFFLSRAVYDAANKQQAYGNTSYTWDNNGNQVAKTTNQVTVTMTWNQENKLTVLHDGSNLTFIYSADGLRRSKTVDGVATHYLYDAVRRSRGPWKGWAVGRSAT